MNCGKSLFPKEWKLKKENIKVDAVFNNGKVNVTINLSEGMEVPEKIKKRGEKVLLLTMNESIFNEGLISEEIYYKARADIEKLYA